MSYIQPNRSARHTNAPLTNISIAYFQDASNFVADRVFPTVPVSKSTDLYYIINREDWNRNNVKKRARGSKPAIMTHELGTDTYSCDIYALGDVVTDEDEADTDEVLAQDTNIVEGLTRQGLINREESFVEQFMSASSAWTNKRTGVASNPTGDQRELWSNDSSDPIKQVEAEVLRIMELTGYKPNKLTLSYPVYSALKNHADIIDRVKYGQTAGGPAIVNLNTLAQVFDVDEILVTSAIHNTATEGQDESNSFIAGKSALLTYSAQSPSRRAPSAGYTFAWNVYSPAGMRMRRHRMEVELSDLIVMDDAYDQKLVADDMGVLFTGIVA